jgi:hypothetical protein
MLLQYALLLNVLLKSMLLPCVRATLSLVSCSRHEVYFSFPTFLTQQMARVLVQKTAQNHRFSASLFKVHSSADENLLPPLVSE